MSSAQGNGLTTMWVGKRTASTASMSCQAEKAEIQRTMLAVCGGKITKNNSIYTAAGVAAFQAK
jgi:hypothetical protein